MVNCFVGFFLRTSLHCDVHHVEVMFLETCSSETGTNPGMEGIYIYIYIRSFTNIKLTFYNLPNGCSY